MTMHKMKLRLSASVVMLSLVACGGGGGDSGSGGNAPVTSTLSFALANGYAARIVSGSSTNYDITRDCSGTATISIAPAVDATFEGVIRHSAAQTSTVTYAATSCKTASNSSTETFTGTTYYNADYVTVGQSINGGEYATLAAPPAAFPTSVKVGDMGDLATLVTYKDSTKAVETGKRVLSYAIEPDTATTVIANITTKTYDKAAPTPHLLSTQQSRFQMTEDGSLKPVSIDIQFGFTSTIHLIYTAK